MSKESIERTVIVKSKGRKYFTCVLGGYKAKLIINEVSESLEADKIVRFKGYDVSVKTKYGSSLTFEPTEIVSVRCAAEAREAAKQRKIAEQKEARAKEELARKEAQEKAEQARKEELKKEQQKMPEQEKTTVKIETYDHRYAVGQEVMYRGNLHIVTNTRRGRYIPDEDACAYGLMPGQSYQQYINTARLASEEEVAEYEHKNAEKEVQKEKKIVVRRIDVAFKEILEKSIFDKGDWDAVKTYLVETRELPLTDEQMDEIKQHNDTQFRLTELITDEFEMTMRSGVVEYDIRIESVPID